MAQSFLRLGDVVPDFQQNSTFGQINFHEFIDKSWAVLFSHPKAFSPICTTELGTVAKMQHEFERRGVKCLVVSVNTVEEQSKWSQDIQDTNGGHPVNFPIIADSDLKFSKLFNMLKAEEEAGELTVTVHSHSLFIIDDNKRLQANINYPMQVGRNFDELFRLIDALQLTSLLPVMTPVNWRNGDRVIISEVLNDKEAGEKFPNFIAVKPYLRYTAEGVNVDEVRGSK